MNAKSKELLVFLQGNPLGILSEDTQGRHVFTYLPESDVSLNLSIALPHRTSPWTGAAVEAYIDGVLPDDPNIRQRIGRQYGVNARNPFALLSVIGLDCAGGVQFVPPAQIDTLRRTSELVPISEEQIGLRLQAMGQGGRASWQANDEHWSLNGAQDKIALRRQNGQWYEAHGAEATTHIIKPGISNLLEQSFNEYVCMKTISNLGVPTAESTYHMFGDVPAIISTRWDREIIDDNNIPKVARIHQEDFCQALGFMTAQKYQSDGGPDALAIVQFLYTEHFSPPDIHLFYTALILNSLMAGTDAHAKNYAILEPAGESPMLAPLYDIASLFPYDTQRKQRKLAMSIGREYNYERIELRHWDRFAAAIIQACKSDDSEFIHFALQHYAEKLPQAFRATAEEEMQLVDGMDRSGQSSQQRRQLIERIQHGIDRQCERVMRWFES